MRTLPLSLRLRARLLQKEDNRPPTIGTWLADLGKVIATLVCLGIFVVIFTAGTPLLRAILISWFGYRPIGTLDDSLVLAFLVVAAPATFLAFTFCMIIVLWTYRSLNWIGTHIVISVPIVGFAFFLVYGNFLGPQLNKYQHLNNWPAQLELVSFNVCAIEVVREPLRTLAPVGRITLELANRSAVAITSAAFSVKTGSNWHRVSIADLPPHAKRLLHLKRDLGAIEAELSGGFTGRARRSAEIYWDHVYPREVMQQLTKRPDIAQVSPIATCPR